MPRRYVTGKASFGVNQRNAASGTATPATTRPEDVGRVVDGQVQPGERDRGEHHRDDELGQAAGRPGTTSEYAMPIRQAARIATGNDGSEKPIQSPMIVTPYGRGRLVRKETRCR